MEIKYLVAEKELTNIQDSQQKILQLLNEMRGVANTQDEKYLTRFQAIELLNISLPTLHKLMNEGKIIFKKFGKSTRFLRSDILNLKAQPHE